MSRTHPTSNFTNEDINPCIEESKLTQKCLDKELYDYSKCSPYFENYKVCRMFWGHIRRKRAEAGIKPELPKKEEREKIMKLKQEGIRVIAAND